jgi:hypothetical protein
VYVIMTHHSPPSSLPDVSCPDQTPPRREFRVSDPEIRGKSLFDLRLSPSSVLYVKFVDEHINRAFFSSRF